MFNTLLAEVTPPLAASAISPAATQTDATMQLVILVLLFAGMYFLVVAPANAKAKLHEKLLKELTKGDEVITTGGIYGTIASIHDERVRLKVADKTEIEVQLTAIAGKVEKKD